MSIINLLQYVKPLPFEHFYYKFEYLFNDQSQSLDLNCSLMESAIKIGVFNNVSLYAIREWSVDDHCGGMYLYTFGGQPFAQMTTEHEDRQDYTVLDKELFLKVYNIFKKYENDLVDPVQEEDLEELNQLHYSPFLIFGGNIHSFYGENLLYTPDDNIYHHIKSWKLTDKGRFDDFIYITLEDSLEELLVPSTHVLGVFGDSREIANMIVAGKFNHIKTYYYQNKLYSIEE